MAGNRPLISCLQDQKQGPAKSTAFEVKQQCGEELQNGNLSAKRRRFVLFKDKYTLHSMSFYEMSS